MTGVQTCALPISGDTLGEIAKKYRTTIALIKMGNNLKSDVIRIGQKFLLNIFVILLNSGGLMFFRPFLRTILYIIHVEDIGGGGSGLRLPML